VALAISMFPPISTVSPLYLIIRALGLRDTWWALVATHTTFALPLNTVDPHQFLPGNSRRNLQSSSNGRLYTFPSIL
jgi:ABC-type glycerol-3-phosphate transport system permease component